MENKKCQRCEGKGCVDCAWSGIIFKNNGLEKAIKKIIPIDVDIEYKIYGENYIITRTELIEKIIENLKQEGSNSSQA